jgi:uncharacterized protein (DUF58 family)
MTILPGEHTSAWTGPVRDQFHLMGILAAVTALGLATSMLAMSSRRREDVLETPRPCRAQ